MGLGDIDPADVQQRYPEEPAVQELVVRHFENQGYDEIFTFHRQIPDIIAYKDGEGYWLVEVKGDASNLRFIR